MARYSHISQLLSFFGLDLRSSELTRQRGFLSDGSQDYMHSPQGAMKTRYGSKYIASGYGKVGLTRFDTTSMLGVSKTEIIGFGADSLNNSTYPWVLTRGSFVLTNSHASTAATVTHYYDEATSQFRFKIVRGTTLIDQALGVGTEGSPYMLSSLETAVDALTSFAMSTPTNASTTPAAFMELLTGDTVAANSGTLTVYYYYWAQVPSTATTSGVYATLKNPFLEVGSESCRNVSTAAVRGVLYMATGNTAPATVAGGSTITTAVLTKYDGQDFYRAGFADDLIKNKTSTTVAVQAAGAIADAKGNRTPSSITGDFGYAHSFVRIDKAGNRVETELAKVFVGAATTPTDPPVRETPAAQMVKVNMNALRTLAEVDYGYSHRFAQVNGGQSNVSTITVDSGHNITAGSIAYFWDSSQSRFIQREVTAVAATTITIALASLDSNPDSPNYDDGTTVSVLDNAYISNNLRVAIWRTKDAGTSLYLLVEIPLWAATAGTPGQSYYDDADDGDLGAEYVAPAFARNEPPQGRFLCSFNDQLIVTGNDCHPNTTYFSDESPEYFPRDTHEFDVEEKTTGCHQTGEVLAIGTRNTLNIVSGDLLNFAFRVSKIGNNIGVTSHFSMKEAMEGVLMFSSYKGPYVLTGGRDLRPLGASEIRPGVWASRLEPYWTQLYSLTAAKPVFERAIAEVLPNDSLYVLFVPTEDPAAPAFATSASVVFAYNWTRDAWYKWTGWNCAGGMAVLDDQLIFTSRSYDGSGTPSYDDIVTYGSQQQKRKSQYNFADHATAITWRIRSHWETLGRANFFKRFLRWKIMSDETREASSTSMTIKTYVDRDTSKLSTTDTLTWTTEKSLRPKIKGELCQSMQFVCESSAYYAPNIVSGYEIEASADFRPEIKE